MTNPRFAEAGYFVVGVLSVAICFGVISCVLSGTVQLSPVTSPTQPPTTQPIPAPTPTTQPPEFVYIRGRITDPNGNPVAGVPVTAVTDPFTGLTTYKLARGGS